jgi:hypothetical protein
MNSSSSKSDLKPKHNLNKKPVGSANVKDLSKSLNPHA